METIDMEEMFEELARVSKADRPRLPEAVFVRSLLPLLINSEGHRKVDLSVWSDIAGNPHREIDVIGANNEVLFSVPPLLQRLPTIAPDLQRKGASVSEIAYIYGQKVVNEHAIVADAYLETQLRNQPMTADEETLLNHFKAWVGIYTRYKLPLDKLIKTDDGKLLSTVELATEKGTDKKDTPSSGSGQDQLSGEFDEF